MTLYDKKGREIRLSPPPRPADDAQPIGWVLVPGVWGMRIPRAVWGEITVDWAHAQTIDGGFVTPTERALVWGTGRENYDGTTWDVPCVSAVPLNWREEAAEHAAKLAAEQAAWEAGTADREAADQARKAAQAEREAQAAVAAPEPHTKWGNWDRGESGRWDRYED